LRPSTHPFLVTVVEGLNLYVAHQPAHSEQTAGDWLGVPQASVGFRPFNHHAFALKAPIPRQTPQLFSEQHAPLCRFAFITRDRCARNYRLSDALPARMAAMHCSMYDHASPW
jgi:hypothetical protein